VFLGVALGVAVGVGVVAAVRVLRPGQSESTQMKNVGRLRQANQEGRLGGSQAEGKAAAREEDLRTAAEANSSQATRTTQTPPQTQGEVQVTAEQRAAVLKEEELHMAEALVKEFPKSEEPLVLLGDVHHRRGHTDVSTSLWEKALQMNPKRADVYDRLAQFAHDTDDYGKAIDLWRRALEIDPNMQGAHVGIARSMMATGKFQESIPEIQEEVKVSPGEPVCYYFLGQAYQHVQDYENARQNYEKAVALQPDHTNAHYGLYTIYTRLKESEKAQQHLAEFERWKARDVQKIRERDQLQTDLNAFSKNLATLCAGAYRMYEPTHEDAKKEQVLKRAVALDPQNTRTKEKLAVLYGMQGRNSEALTLCREIEQIDPNNPACQYNIGRLSILMGRREDAERALQRLIVLEPKYYTGYQELARLYLRFHVNLPRARELAQKAVDLDPRADGYFVLGWACYANKDDAAAKTSLQKAMSLDPKNAAYIRCYQTVIDRGEFK